MLSDHATKMAVTCKKNLTIMKLENLIYSWNIEYVIMIISKEWFGVHDNIACEAIDPKV
jgi:hypothetical protein